MALRGYYATLPLHWALVLGLLPFMQDRLIIFSLLVLLEIFLFFAEIYTRRSYARYRMHALFIFLAVAVEDRVRGVGFSDGLKSTVPDTFIDILVGCNE